jgi:uncharacterized membrane-anchored protein
MMRESSKRMLRWDRCVPWILVLVLAPAVLFAQDEIPWMEGPGTMSLGNQAEIYIDAGYLFADAETTKMIMQMLGNQVSEQEQGLVASASEDKNWILIFEFDPVGYVSDDDGDDIDADAILDSISEGTEAANEYRIEQGFSPLHVVGWSEEPRYDNVTNNLVWAILGQNEEGEQSVNYNVRLLGRHGYMSATLVTDPSTLAADKIEVEQLLTGYQFVEGKRYAEFREGDKLAGYGLTALIAGGAGAAAVKLGLFKVLAKAWKLVVVGFLAVIAFLKKLVSGLFGRPETVRMPQRGYPRR